MAGGSRSTSQASPWSTGQVPRDSRRGPAARRGRTTSQENVAIVRRIFARWAIGDAKTDWADPDIDFCGPDLRIGHGVEPMAEFWGDWLRSMDEFSMVADRFQDAGEDEVLVPLRLVCRENERGASPEIRSGVSLFKLSGGKVVRLSLFIDGEQGLEATA